MTLKAPPLTEAQFLRQVCELAEIRGWQWLHLRPGMTRDSWRTPISGPLGKGWPDLVLVRSTADASDGAQLIFAELKREGGKPTEEQYRVLQELDWLTWDDGGAMIGSPRISVRLWQPSDWDEIEKALR